MRKLCFLALLAGCNDYNLQNRADRDDAPGPDDPDSEVAPGPQPDITVEPMALDFGSLPEGCPAEPMIVTVRNDGDADLDVRAIALAGTGSGAFSVQGGPAVLAPGDLITLELAFLPSATVDYAVALEIESDDPDESLVAVDLGGAGADEAYVEELFEQPAPSAVDVLWVIDNSCSMGEEVGRLQDSFAVFIDSFVAMGLDYQIGVVTTDMSDPTQSGRLQGSTTIITPATGDPVAAFLENTNLGSAGSGDEKGLDASQQALTEPLISADNDGLVREDAMLAVVVLSDEDDSSAVSPSAYTSWLDAYKADPAMSSLSAIVGAESNGWTDPGGCNDWSTGTSASAGDAYIDVADATGGMYGDICDLDFDAVLSYLSYNAAGLSTSFVLSQTPSNLAETDVLVDGAAVPYHGVNGWSWKASANAVEFNGDYIPGPNAVIEITYPVALECP